MPTTADGTIRDRLKAVRTDLQQARSDRAEAKKERDAAKEAFAGHDFTGDSFTDSPEFNAAKDSVKKVGELDDKIAALTMAERDILEMLGQRDPIADNGNGSRPAGRTGWNGHALIEQSDGYKHARQMGLFSSTDRFGTVELGRIDREEFLAAALPAAPAGNIGTDQGAIVPDVRGLIAPSLKRLSLLDIIPTGTTDSNIVMYVQIIAIPGSAAETAELALKPQSGLTTLDSTAPVRTIPGWVKLARQALDDIAGLGTLMNLLLPYDVRRRLESQLLAGDGTGQNLLGILNTTGIGAPAFVAGDNPADAILRAMTVVILSDSEPNFCTMNPITAQNLMLLKATTGQYLYGEPGTYLPPTIWGLTMTQNRVVPQATPLVGDAMGATLLVREGVNIRVSDSDQDDFVRNRVTMLAETRVAFPVWRPSAFAKAALS